MSYTRTSSLLSVVLFCKWNLRNEHCNLAYATFYIRAFFSCLLKIQFLTQTVNSTSNHTIWAVDRADSGGWYETIKMCWKAWMIHLQVPGLQNSFVIERSEVTAKPQQVGCTWTVTSADTVEMFLKCVTPSMKWLPSFVACPFLNIFQPKISYGKMPPLLFW